MTQNQSRQLTITLDESKYADLIRLLDQRIKSERARASAFKRLKDHSNEMVANWARTSLLELRNALINGCCEGVDDV